MAIKPIKIKSESIHINADRRLVFQVVTAFGAGGAEGEPAGRVLEDEGARKLVEFTTPIDLGLGMSRKWVTREWVEMSEPEEITFNLVPGKGPITGGLKLLSDRFEFQVEDGCTNLTYESTFGIRWSIFGWVLGKLLIERYLRKHMREHLQSLKATTESRAERSRVFLPCVHDGAEQAAT